MFKYLARLRRAKVKSDCLGSLSLEMIFTTGAGISFVLLFYNLAQYVGAKVEVKEAVRKAARCISATDGECVRVQTTPVEQNLEWYGYLPSGDNSDANMFVDYYRYSGAMKLNRYSADFDTFFVRGPQQQKITWSEYFAPLVTYQARMVPAYGQNQVSARYSIEYFRPVHEPLFPKVENRNSNDSAPDNDFSPSRWLSKYEKVVPYDMAIDETRTLSVGNNLFSSAVIPIRALEEADSDVRCVQQNGKSCSVSKAAGESKELDNWRSTAYLAIKVFATHVGGGSADVAWAREGGGERAGLYVDIFGPDGNGGLVKKKSRCLGGRARGDISKGNSSYNLYLRGTSWTPKKQTPVCADGSIDHDRIAIPRGGAFKVRAYLHSRDQVKVNVKVAYYYDDYRKHSKAVVCPARIQPKPLAGADLCNDPECLTQQAPEEAKLFAESAWQIQCQQVGVSQKIDCQDAASRLDVQLEAPQVVQKVALCSQNWQPPAPKAELFDSQWQFCGWDKVMEERAVVSEQKGCPLSRLSGTKEVLCSVTEADVKGGSSGGCVEADTAISNLEQQTAALNSNQPEGAEKFSTAVPVSKVPVEESWNFSWVPPEEGHTKERGSEFRKVSDRVPAELSSVYRIARNDGRQDLPSPIEFLDAISRLKPDQAKGPQWEMFKQHASDYIRVNPSPVSETESFEATYPFSGPVKEIFYGQQRQWSSNCAKKMNFSCSLPQFSGLEEMLRFYAAKTVPQAVAKESGEYVYQFLNPSAVYDHSEVVVEVSKLKDVTKAETGMGGCQPRRIVCTNAKEPIGNAVYLGKSGDMPAGCISGSYVNCFSLADGLAEGNVTEDVQHDIAAMKGLADMQVIVPYAQLKNSCQSESDSGCLSFAFSYPEADRVRVEANYLLPLTFPFDAILGKKSLLLSAVQEEVLERKVVGRGIVE